MSAKELRAANPDVASNLAMLLGRRVPAMTLTVNGQVFPVETVNEASAIVNRLRDESGEGASTFGVAFPLRMAGLEIGYVSYNGKVWDARDRLVWPLEGDLCAS